MKVRASEDFTEEAFGMDRTDFATHETWSASLPLCRLAEQFGSPLYVIHERQLDENYAILSGQVGKVSSGEGSKGVVRKSLRVTYPVKANPSRFILRKLAALGAQADCASAEEVRWALGAGFSIDRIVYNTPAPDRKLLVDLLIAGATIVVDSLELLRYVSGELLGDTRIRQSQGHESSQSAGRILLRVNPQGFSGYRSISPWEHLVAHGSCHSKFGIPEEEIVESNLDGTLPIDGLHLHVGTQMDTAEGWGNSIHVLHRLADRLRSIQGRPLSVIDLGGGLAIPFTESQRYPRLGDYIAIIREEMREESEYWIEPGHALVGNAVGLVTTVCELKETRGKRWGICDVGTDQLSRVTLAGWRHPVIREGGRALAVQGPDSLGGPLCFAGDVLLTETDLGDVKRGDVLLVQHVGAYCASAGSRFNGRLSPAEIVVRSDGAINLSCVAEEGFWVPESLGAKSLLMSEPSWSSMVDVGERERCGNQGQGGNRELALALRDGECAEKDCGPKGLRHRGVGERRWEVLEASQSGSTYRLEVCRTGSVNQPWTVGDALEIVEQLVAQVLRGDNPDLAVNPELPRFSIADTQASGQVGSAKRVRSLTWAIEQTGPSLHVARLRIVLEVGCDEGLSGEGSVHQIRFDAGNRWLSGVVRIANRVLD